MRIFNVLTVLVLTFMPTSLIASDFRDFSWGDSIETVKNSEGSVLLDETETFLSYSGSIAGISFEIIYEFYEGKLIGGRYINKESYTDDDCYFQDYEKFKELLSKKYGEAIKDTYAWQNGLYKDDPSNWGKAIRLGHLHYRSVWIKEKTLITHTLSGDNSAIKHVIIYYDTDYAWYYNNRKDKEALEQL